MNEQQSTNPLSDLEKSVKTEADRVKQLHDEAEVKANEVRDEKGLPHQEDPSGEKDPEEYDLFKVVVNSIMNVVNDPSIQQAFVSLRDKFSRLGTPAATVDTGDISKELIEIISMSVSYSVIMSINFYDTELKRSLEKDFIAENEILTRIESDLLATTMKVLEIQKLLAIPQNPTAKSE